MYENTLVLSKKSASKTLNFKNWRLKTWNILKNWNLKNWNLKIEIWKNEI